MTVLLGLLLLAHGLVHVGVWLPRGGDVPFDAGRSWAFGDVRRVSAALAALVAALFAVGGAGHLLQAAWWPAAVLTGAGVSLVLVVVTFSRWFLAGLAIDVGAGLLAVGALTW